MFSGMLETLSSACPGCGSDLDYFEERVRKPLLDPRMQPTGRGRPRLLAGTLLPVAKLWKR
jgi:hypothetical protein